MPTHLCYNKTMEYNFTNAPIDNRPAEEPKKESKIKPIYILYIIGALIVILGGAIVAITIVNNVNEQQAAEQKAEDEKNAAQAEKEAATIEKFEEKMNKIILGNATSGEKELFEQDALEFINDPTTTGNNKAQIARSLANFYLGEDRVDDAIDLLDRIAHQDGMTSNGTIVCLMDLADIYASQKDTKTEKAILEEVINLPDHTMHGMVWEGDGGYETVVKERLEQINESE